MSNREIFGEIYKSKVWGDGSDEKPLSGSGSSPQNAKPFVDYVKSVISREQISSVLELGHGDWAMWRDYKFPNSRYLGIDVADGLSEIVQGIYGDATHTFQFLDFLENDLPEAELFITKDVLQHISNRDVTILLGSLSSFKTVIICNDVYIRGSFLFELKEFLQIRRRIKRALKGGFPFYSGARVNNLNILGGQCRGIDLEKKPFKNLLTGMSLITSFDYDGPARKGIRKRVYHFANDAHL
jgi:hypothetical protein